jgi:Rod binding domain-containing protein
MSDSTITPTTIYTGIAVKKENKPKELNSNPTIDDRKYVPTRFKEVAASMEQQFVEMMLDQMDKTVDEANPDEGGQGMEYYKSLQKNERAKAMTHQNELGLQDMILNQIYPKRMRNEIAFKHYEDQNSLKHHNLPSYKKPANSDSIVIGKNDSSLEQGKLNTSEPNSKDGGNQ